MGFFKPALATSNQAATTGSTSVVRFFDIAVMLPMELQMVLSHRVVGSMKQNILMKDSEAAFKALAMRLIITKSK